MTIRDINDIIQAVCSNDEDYEKPFISPKYLRQELEKLALEQEQRMLEPTTKNDSGVDCISREQALNEFCIYNSYDSIGVDKVRSYLIALPSVTPQKPQTFKWCTDCREYDQEKHCCHRWSKVIRNTAEEMKQGYIEREVLDKIRAEICAYSIYVMPQYGRTIREADVLHIIDKYKEQKDGKV